MTLEAALILPVVLFVILFVIYSGVAMYDRCVMEEDTRIAVLRGSNMFRKTSEEIAGYIQTECIRMEPTELLLLSDYKGSVKADLLKVSVTMEGNTEIRFRSLLDKEGDPLWEIHTIFEADRYHPGRILRILKIAENRKKEEGS